jgi:orotidine-5'-phosphate decarboxylase
MLPLGLRADSRDLSALARSYADFCRGVIDTVAPLVPAVKPQAAFFEELGPFGLMALAEVIDYARGQNLIVILDAKRGDVGSTAEAYARGLLGDANQGSPLASDALTVNPYLGGDALEPFVDVARERNCGLFVLVKTSNPGSGVFQNLPADGRPVYRHVAELVHQWAEKTRGASAYGAIGAVVGATYPNELAELRAAMPSAWLLVPGYGSQGGRASDVAGAFDEQGLGAVINSSRGIIFAYRRQEFASFGEDQWQEAVEAATREMIAALRAETPASKL